MSCMVLSSARHPRLNNGKIRVSQLKLFHVNLGKEKKWNLMHALDYTPQKKTKNSLKTEKSRPQNTMHMKCKTLRSTQIAKECRVCFCLGCHGNNNTWTTFLSNYSCNEMRSQHKVWERETKGRKCYHLHAKNHGVIFQAASPAQLPVMSYNGRDTDTASGRQSSRLRSHIRIMHSKLNA